MPHVAASLRTTHPRGPISGRKQSSSTQRTLHEVEVALHRDYRAVGPMLNQILRILNRAIGFDLGVIGLVEDEGARRIIIKGREFSGLPAQESGPHPHVKYVKIGGRELPRHERSFIGYVGYTRRPRQSANVHK